MVKFPRLIPFAALAVLALAGCTATPAEPVADETTAPVVETTEPAVEQTTTPDPVETPKPTPTPTPLSVADCADGPTGIIRLPADAYFPSYTNTAILDGEIFDTGPRDLAAGDPTLNAGGQIVSYTVGPGEALSAIAERFCIGERTLGAYNHTFGYDIQPGDVLALRPDPDEPWSRN